ncbi:MAG: terminase TerL endonuclease subunit [Deltaproteobacteria bacterium]
MRKRPAKKKAKLTPRVKAGARDHVEIAEAFAASVLDGSFPAGKLLVAAVKRQASDLKRQGPGFAYVFDAEVGAKACRFLELLPHVDGPKSRQSCVLEPWQVWTVIAAYSWVSKVTRYPRYRRLTLFVAKGQGKTFLAAGLALHSLATGTFSEKIYSAATTRDQAGLSFQTARMMLNFRPEVRDHFGLVVEQHQIVRPESGSHFKPISSEAGSAEGKIPAFILEDEIHAHKTRDLHDNLRSMAAKIPYSRQVVISTAGFDMSPAAIGYEVFGYARDILLGAVTDDSQFALIIDADRELDPWAPSTWRMANPNMGVSIDEVEVANEANEAKQVLSKQPSFFTKRLNWWCQAASAWMDTGSGSAWDKCHDREMRREDFDGASSFIGIDLAQTRDLSAVVNLFVRDGDDGRRNYFVFCHAYLPGESETLRQGNDTLRVWAQEGFLSLTPGRSMEPTKIILPDVVADMDRNPGSEVCLDPWGGVALVQELTAAGYENQVVQIRQGAKTQSAPMQELEAAVLDGRLHHDGNPLLRWCVGNVVARADRNGNIAPDRESDGKKIDCAVALINAMVRGMLGSEQAYANGEGLSEL